MIITYIIALLEALNWLSCGGTALPQAYPFQFIDTHLILETPTMVIIYVYN